MSSGDRAGVLEALRCSCSQEPSVLKVGEQQLKAWEKEAGFYTALAVSLSSSTVSERRRHSKSHIHGSALRTGLLERVFTGVYLEQTKILPSHGLDDYAPFL